MSQASTDPGILLIDDGELEDVARALERQGCSFERLQGGSIPRQLAPPRDLLVATPRRIERVRRGSPPDAGPDRPLRILASDETSPAMQRRARRLGVHLLVGLPADDEIWRLLISRALYRGRERRRESRVAVVSPVELEIGESETRPAPGTESGTASMPGTKTSGASGASAAEAAASAADGTDAERPRAILLDVSNRGCRLRTSAPASIGESLAFTILPDTSEGLGDGEPLALRGRIRRMTRDPDAGEQSLAVVFDGDLPEPTRIRLAALINGWASGPSSTGASPALAEPALPPCRLPSLPDLLLDDETDPAIRPRSQTRVALSASPVSRQSSRASRSDLARNPEDRLVEAGAVEGDRRRQPRGRFDTSFLAETPTGPLVMIGRELSPGGMRVERIEELRVGDRFRLALHGPGPGEPIVVEAEVDRDDGRRGYALVFRRLDATTTKALEKLVACLPGVDSEGDPDPEVDDLGALLSEIMSS